MFMIYSTLVGDGFIHIVLSNFSSAGEKFLVTFVTKHWDPLGPLNFRTSTRNIGVLLCIIKK